MAISTRNWNVSAIIPADIKYDIIYCQRNLRTYLKVYEMVLSREKKDARMLASPSGNLMKVPTVRYYLDEIEKDIYEINAEQKLLLKRLHSTLDEYNRSLLKNKLKIDTKIGYKLISKQLIPLIKDHNFKWEPVNVKKRLNERQLIAKYGLDDDKIFLELNDARIPSTITLGIYQNSSYNSSNSSQNIINGSKQNQQQISLLKPKEERFALQRNANYKQLFPYHGDESKMRKESKTESSKKIFVPVSPAINSSRLNLLQALNKARTQQSTTSNNNLVSSTASSTSSVASVTQQGQNKYKRRNSSLTLTSSSSSSSSSSASSSSSSAVAEESPDDNTREPSPVSSEEIKLEPSIPEEYGQEMFLKMFGLYTHEYSNYLIEKRSKRKRRNVQSNEKSDYHYGRLEIFESADKRKKKVYLASPSANKVVGNKKRKIGNDRAYVRTSMKKSSSSEDRSHSSSPESERVCNECMKAERKDRSFSCCDACNGLFHIECHSGGFCKQPIELKKRICPPCQRDKLNFIAEYQVLPSDSGCDDDNDIVSLTIEQKKLQENNRDLLMKYKKFRNRYHDLLKFKQNLIRRGDLMKVRLNSYFDVVKNFKKSATALI